MCWRRAAAQRASPATPSPKPSPTLDQAHCRLLYRTFAYYSVGPNSGLGGGGGGGGGGDGGLGDGGGGDGGGHSATWDLHAFLAFCEQYVT